MDSIDKRSKLGFLIKIFLKQIIRTNQKFLNTDIVMAFQLFNNNLTRKQANYNQTGINNKITMMMRTATTTKVPLSKANQT